MSDVDGTVVALQGNAVSNTAPNDHEVLTWDATAGEWQPKVVQSMEPWVGSNGGGSQRQIIQRIPWTCTSTGTAIVSTGVSYTLPTDSGLVGTLHIASRWTGYEGIRSTVSEIVVSNWSGTLKTGVSTPFQAALGNAPNVPYVPDVSVSISGTTATVMIGHSGAGPGDVMEMQGYVDLMLI
jgi:hypothetical protein